MLKDEVLEKLFMNKEMQNFCICSQSDIVRIFEDVLNEIRRENPNVSVSELYDE